MPLTLDAVHAAAMKLPGVAVATKWGNRTWVVHDKGFAWERPLRKADLERLGDAKPPTAPILAVRTEDLDAKDALLAMELPGFFTIQHFNNYAAVLIELRKARAADVRMAMEEAHRVLAAKAPRRKKRAPTKRARKR
jgi:hypothetical protein